MSDRFWQELFQSQLIHTIIIVKRKDLLILGLLNIREELCQLLKNESGFIITSSGKLQPEVKVENGNVLFSERVKMFEYPHLLSMFILSLCFFILYSPLFAMVGSPSDSLKKVLLRTRPDTMRVRILNTLAETYATTHRDSAIIYGKQAQSLSEQLAFNPGLAEALRIIGICHMREQEYGIASSHLHRSLALWASLGNADKQRKIHFALGHIAEQRSDFSEALKQYLSSLRFADQIGDKSNVLSLQMSIGAVYGHMEQHSKAIELFEKVLHAYELIGDSLGIAQACNNLGNELGADGRHAEARTYLNRAVILVRALRHPIGEAITLGSLANHYQRIDRYDSALACNERILVLFKEIGDPFRLAAASINTGEVLTRLKRYKEAKDYLNKGIEYAKSVGANQWLANAHAGLYDIAYEQGDAKEALEQFKLHIAYQDTITNEANTRKAVEVQMQYDFDKREAETRANQEKKDQHQRLVRNGIGSGLAIALVFLVVVLRQRNHISKEKARSEELLLNILPEETAKELKEKGHSEAQLIDDVTILFTDFKGFTLHSEKVTPKELVADLHDCFSAFDRICEKYGVEKIKTIGDSYMAAGGLPTPNNTHAQDVLNVAFEMVKFIEEGKAKKINAGIPYFEIRIGLHTGPVVAGIVGIKKFQYDIWGDTVNTASRMESSGEAGKINVSQTTYEILKDSSAFSFEYRGKVEAKGKGELAMYFANLSEHNESK